MASKLGKYGQKQASCEQISQVCDKWVSVRWQRRDLS